jgi:serine/threonine protein kinase
MTLEIDFLLNNRYQILDVLGKGGMGAVYRALDVHLNLEVAVKENLFLSSEYTRQFQREATILAGMRHSNLPKVSDYFLIPGQGQYMIMDFIQGEDLRQRMERSGPLPEDEVTLIGIAVCDALAYLHTRRPPIIHRDLKPGNIKINPEGQIVLVDFGLAKILVDKQVTITGARAMTPGYSPPEQYGTARTDARSDIYSLAATLYASLTGIIPEDSLARATGNAVLTPIRQLDPRINRKLATAIEKALELDPVARYQTAEELKSSLLDAIIQTRTVGREIMVTPPPADAAALVPVEPLDESAPVSDYSYPYARKSQPIQAWRSSGSWLALAVLAIVLWGGLNLFRNPPNSIRQVVAAFLPVTPSITAPAPTMEPTNQPAEAAIKGSPTPTETIQPTQTLEPTQTSTAKPTPFGGSSGEIAFVSTRTGIAQIWRMDAYGGNLVQVTNLPDGACQPDWSPDGARLVFISPCQGRREIYERTSLYIVNADGTGVQALPGSPEGDFDPAWSPDGIHIAFTSLRSGQVKIYVMNLSDQSVSMISNSPYNDRNPAWAPSGMQLAFVRARTSAQIWISTDTGQNETQFSRSGDLNDIWPVWSPDGQSIFFTQTSKDLGIPWLMTQRYENRGTSQAFRIPEIDAPKLGPAGEVSVSADGFWLAYEGWPDGTNHDIYRMSITGASVQRLTTDRAIDFQPVWRPAP